MEHQHDGGSLRRCPVRVARLNQDRPHLLTAPERPGEDDVCFLPAAGHPARHRSGGKTQLHAHDLVRKVSVGHEQGQGDDPFDPVRRHGRGGLGDARQAVQVCGAHLHARLLRYALRMEGGRVRGPCGVPSLCDDQHRCPHGGRNGGRTDKDALIEMTPERSVSANNN